MARKKAAKTLFEFAAEESQAAISETLGLNAMRVSRIVRGAVDVDSEVVQRAREVWGSAFDEVGTLAEWVRRHLEWSRRCDETPPHPSDAA